MKPSIKYIKRQIPVQATFAATAGELETMEGRVRYEKNDALMTGSEDERWPIMRDTFEATYDPVPPLLMGEDGYYIKKPLLVEARQVDNDGLIVLEGQRGELKARSGDWIVTGAKGKQWVVADAIFQDMYQALDVE